MEAIDFWKLCSDYSIVQAALLICGANPDDLQFSVDNSSRHRPAGYVAARTAIYNAVRTGLIEATVVYDQQEFGNAASINAHETMIHVSDLNEFLNSRGMTSSFFDRSGLPSQNRFPAESAQFPRKLDAANKAWTAVTSDPARLRGKSPKQALEAWLTENAAELGLLNKDGAPNRSGIEEICKVANWKPEGGATPTPSAKSVQVTPSLIQLPDPRRTVPSAPPPRETFSADLDDEIPF